MLLINASAKFDIIIMVNLFVKVVITPAYNAYQALKMIVLHVQSPI